MSYHIQVCCRIRPKDALKVDEQPFSEKTYDQYENDEDPIKVVSSENASVKIGNEKEKGATQIHVNGKANFAIDHVFEDAPQDEVFKESLEPLLSDLFTGIHCTLFTYGQTGSGKTYTVIGGNDDHRGLLPRSIEYIFDKIDQINSEENEPSKKEDVSKGFQPQIIVKLSIVEIYHEKLMDLLKVTAQKNPLPGMDEASNLAIRQASDGTIFVENLSEISIQNKMEFQKYLAIAQKKRQMGSHKLNEYSSRSHLCCLVDLLQWKYNASGTPIKLHSKLSIIDLAGSEMAKKTEVTGQRFQEAKFINKSLSALSKVISALAVRQENNGVANSTHIPFRDSKLTRLLQNSLSGNSKMVIILTISKNPAHLSETISTLKFGERARLVKVSPQVNRENSMLFRSMKLEESPQNAEHTRELEDTINQLKEQIISLNQIINDLRNDQLPQPSEPEISDSNLEKSNFFEEMNRKSTLCNVCHKALNSLEKTEQRKGGSYEGESSPTKIGIENDREGELDEYEKEEDEIDDDEEPPAEEIIERCAICGLNSQETEELKQLTNEDLGFLFSCDGNCGNKFHIRCAGVVGEAGQYILPEGEWFCNDCTVQISDTALQKEKEEQKKIHQSPVKVPPRSSSETKAAPEDNEHPDTPFQAEEIFSPAKSIQESHVTQHLVPTTTHYKEVLIYMNLITNLQQKYNLMRKERNSILNHFHQEKKISQQLELLKSSKIEELLNENSTLIEENEDLSVKLRTVEQENKFLQDQIQSLQNQHQTLYSSHGQNMLLASQSSLNKWVSLTESQELKSVLGEFYLGEKSQTTEAFERHHNNNNHVNQNSPTVNEESSRVNSSSSKSYPTQNFNNARRTVEEVDGLQTLERENRDELNFQESSNVPLNQEKKPIPKPWLKSSTSNSNLPIPLQQNTSSKFSSKSSEVLHPPLDSEENSNETSRFINPFKNRLSELIDLVQEETSSFQEIRHQYQQSLQNNKDRNNKRNE